MYQNFEYKKKIEFGLGTKIMFDHLFYYILSYYSD